MSQSTALNAPFLHPITCDSLSRCFVFLLKLFYAIARHQSQVYCIKQCHMLSHLPAAIGCWIRASTGIKLQRQAILAGNFVITKRDTGCLVRAARVTLRLGTCQCPWMEGESNLTRLRVFAPGAADSFSSEMLCTLQLTRELSRDGCPRHLVPRKDGAAG